VNKIIAEITVVFYALLMLP